MENMNETAEARCALCVRNGNCAKIFDSTYEEKTADELFLYCTGLKIIYNEFKMCPGCMFELIRCYHFVKKCRELPSKYIEKNYLNIDKTLRNNTIKQEILPEEETLQSLATNEELSEIRGIIELTTDNEDYMRKLEALQENHNLQGSNVALCNKIEIEIDQEIDAEFNEVTSNNDDESLIQDGNISISKNHDRQHDVDEIGEEIKIEQAEIVQSGAESASANSKMNLATRKRRGSRRQQVDVHAANKTIKRDIREKQFSKKSLRQAEGKNECEICGKKFSKNSTLLDHSKVHKGQILYSCDTCGKSFAYKRNLNNHVSMAHLNQTMDKCPKCGKLFRKNYLDIHVRRVHSDKTTCPCRICGKELSNEKSLERHMRIHGTEQLYVCESCGKSFRYKHSMLKHVDLSHLNKETCQCSQCGKSFLCLKYLRKHIRVIHSGIKPFACDICRKKFESKYFLKLHMKKAHVSKAHAKN